jgi:surfeit locus 1 family protein
MPLTFTFRFRWIPFLAALLAASLGVSLGQWQMRRAAEKEGIETRLAQREAAPETVLQPGDSNAADLEYRKLVAKGEFIGQWAVYLDNRPYKGGPGFYLAMPLKIAGSDSHILVLRGWIPRNTADRARLPTVPVPPPPVVLHGTVRITAGHVLQLGSEPALRPGSIVQNLDVAQFASASGLKMLPFILEQTSDTADGLVRDWPRPSSGVDKHYGYAFQWFALAATALIFFIATGLRRGNGKDATAHE